MAFIVLEGNDGSGKATQTKLLADALENEGYRCVTYAFPAYQDTIGGKLLAELVSGKRGNFSKADPRLASLPYSIDRYEVSASIRLALADRKLVIADRFIGSNQIHQGGKLKSIGERTGYLEWLDTLEHGLLGIPRPDLIIYLKIPVDVSLELLAEKRASKGGILPDGEMDQVEKDREYLENSHAMANWLSGHYEHWRVIDCIDHDSRMRSRENIHADVLREVMELL